jgi:hypothetical protein
MMILSRIWYLILALLLAAAGYVVSLAVGQYNRRNMAAMDETLKADTQVVRYALEVDARRRLDNLLLPAVDANVIKAIAAANGKAIPASSRDEGAKALRAFNDKLPAEYRSDVLMIADREGRLVAQVGYDAVNAFPEFEIGGYAAVNDALHGFLRDDTWVWGGKLARIVTRPVEAEVGQAPVGAIVALRWFDNAFAKQIAMRTRTNIAFFALAQRTSSAPAPENGLDEQSLEALGGELKSVAEDKDFKETGRTAVRPLGTDLGGVMFAKLPGDAWDLGGGYAVARARIAISSPLGFINGADDADKRNVTWKIIIPVALGAMLFGLLFSYLEHSVPMKELARQAARLKKGELDMLQLPRFRGGYRPIATDINDGIQRVVEKGGGQARKPADLESILGPVPAQPNMSAFSFPLNDPSNPPLAMPPGQGFGAPNGPPPPGQRFGQAPPPVAAGRPVGPPAAPGPVGRPGPTPPSFVGQDRTMALGNAALGAAPPPSFGAPVPPAPIPAAGSPPGASGPVNQSATVAAKPGGVARLDDGEEQEETAIGKPSDALLSASGAGPTVLADGGLQEWRVVYDDFVRTKRECGEPTDGLTFEKFQQTLRKNRDALMQRHGCKRVKFSVYVKEGRASLKATPVRE